MDDVVCGVQEPVQLVDDGDPLLVLSYKLVSLVRVSRDVYTLRLTVVYWRLFTFLLLTFC